MVEPADTPPTRWEIVMGLLLAVTFFDTTIGCAASVMRVDLPFLGGFALFLAAMISYRAALWLGHVLRGYREGSDE